MENNNNNNMKKKKKIYRHYKSCPRPLRIFFYAISYFNYFSVCFEIRIQKIHANSHNEEIVPEFQKKSLRGNDLKYRGFSHPGSALKQQI